MKKVILVSSFTLCVSTVMPWYDQRNNFGVGDTYLGIQGPLFMVGALVLACGAVSFFNMFLPLLGRNFFDLKRKTGSVALMAGAQALLLLLVANSIFFHPAFATTINSKSTRFGMVAAFFSIGAMLIAGWWIRRKDRAGGEEREDEIEDFMQQPLSAPRMREEEEETVPVQDTYERPVYQAPSYQGQSYQTPSYQSPVRQSTPSQVVAHSDPGVDPLTLDARTRYKMMRSQSRFSSNARNNLWGGGTGSAYGARREEEREY